jgi:hypothetical protein
VAAIKVDGFLLLDMQVADDLSGSPKQEAKVRVAVERRLKVARWLGHPLGNQLDLFEKASPTATIDRAYDDGKRVGMEGGKADVPDHFVEAELLQAWTKGWHDGQAVKIRTGIKQADKEWDAAAPTGGSGWSQNLPPAAQQDSDL